MFTHYRCYFIIILILLYTSVAYSQSNFYYFSPLSSNAYKSKISTYKNRKIPVEYADKKSQKTYAEIIKERNENLTEEFENDELLYDTLLLNKCNSIFNRIKSANSTYRFDSIEIYINRSHTANACCYGEGTLFVNLGLFLWIDSDEELALVIGHEISHQLLNHSESKIKKNIALLSSEDYKEEIKAIKKSTDSKYLRIKKLLKDMIVETGTHSRYKESEADSLGVILIKNAGYDIKKAVPVILKLDFVDDLYTAPDFYKVQNIFDKSVTTDFKFISTKKYNGLSGETVTMNAERDMDSVKTHPDCIVRFKAITANVNMSQEISCCKVLAPALNEIKERSLVELTRHEYERGNLTVCIHLCLFAIQNGFTNPYFNYMIAMSFSKIYEADLVFEKFNNTNTGAKAGSTLKTLQDFIFNCNRENLLSVAAYFLNNGTDKTTEEYFFANMMYKKAANLADANAAENTFKRLYPKSKYNYILTPKLKTK